MANHFADGEETASTSKEQLETTKTESTPSVSSNVGKLPCKKLYHVLVQRGSKVCSISDGVRLALKDANERGFLSASFLCPNYEDSNHESYLDTLIQTLVEFGQHPGTLERVTILCEDSDALELCGTILSDLKDKRKTEERAENVDPEEKEDEDGEHPEEFQFMEVDFDGDARQTNSFSSDTVSRLEVITGSIVDIRVGRLLQINVNRRFNFETVVPAGRRHRQLRF